MFNFENVKNILCTEVKMQRFDLYLMYYEMRMNFKIYIIKESR